MAIATTVALTAGGLTVTAQAATADTSPAAGQPETVTSVPLPTAQIDGVAWAQAIVGNTVYVGGEFTNARPAGAAAGVNTSSRSNLMAYTLSTGVMTSWNPGANGAIRSITASPDGSRIYVSGSFTTIAGASRNRVAAFSTATGALLAWNPGANAQVSDVAAAGNTVWLVGNFTNVAGGSRGRVAAVNATTGALLPFTASVTGGYGIKAVEVSPTADKIVIGGSFTATNGSTNPGRGLAALNSTTGASLEWKVNSVVRNGGENAAVFSLASDGDSVYGTGYDYYGGDEDGFEDVFRASWTDGTMQWITDCHGDTYSVAAGGGVVYSASHDHYCGNIGGFPQTEPKWTFKHSLAFSKEYLGNVVTPDPMGYRSFAGQPAGTLLQWYPEWQVGTYTGKSQAAWDVEASNDYVVYGGEFLRINNVAQQGLVRFGKKSTGAPTGAPQFSGSEWTVTPLSLRAGEVRVSWPANTDRDSQTLTYELFRQDKGSTPVFTAQENSNFWTRPDMKYVDNTVTAGTTYQYRVRATDAEGNSATGAWVSVTATTTQASAYALDVLDDGAQYYWPLGEASGTVGANWAQNGDLTVNAATRGATGPNTASANKATTFAGTTASFATTKTAEASSDVVSLEAWFKTTSTDGGKIIGFGSSATGNSGSYDRMIYLDGSGRITFGVYPGASRTIESGSGFNDGVWHHVVGTLGTNGMTLYVDGGRVSSRADTTSGQAYNGFWRIGGDNLGGWPNVGNSTYLNGSISDVAVYKSVLTRAQVDSHWVAAGRTSTLPAAPADSYGASVFALNPSVFWRLGDTTGSTAVDSGPDAVSGTYFGNVTKGITGALAGVSNKAVTMNPNGNDQTGVTSNKSFTNPTTFSIESWIKTSSTSGGKIVGFGDARTGNSGSNDRHVYMSGDGRVKFGTWTGSMQIIQSAPGFNDNAWHHVVAQMSSAGMQLYIDGTLVASNGNTSAQDYTGYWRVGGDSGWEGDTYWRGSVDEVAIYTSALTPAQIKDHFDLGAIGVVNAAPTASFSSIATGLDVAFDASTSTDAEGPIASYSWNFGDGQTATGATASHTYAHSGTWDVKLTVVDAGGKSATVTQPVTVVGANVLPTSSFTASNTHLAATFDGSASSDIDGTISSYSWAFGDGQTGTGPSVSHTYTGAGSYTVSLTVTDDRGGSATSERVVTATVPPTAPSDVYGSAVYNLSPTIYWRLNESSGAAVRDSSVNDNTGTYFGDVTKSVAGALAAGGDTAVSLNPSGDTQTGVSSNRSFTNPTTFAVETWFKTNSTSGGKLVSFGVARTGTSSNHDRNLYMSGDGRVKFGTWTGSIQSVESAPGLNDNVWHHAVAQLSSSGMQLFIDGQLVSTNPNTSAEAYTGYWRVGGDSAWEGDTYWRGSIDEVAIYPTTLTAAQIEDHFDLGKTGSVNAPPTASFTGVVTDLSVAFDGTASTDLDGPIASYEWNFGDGLTGTGATVTHAYALPGTYQVSLKVTDGQGMTDTITQPFTTVAANVLPTAAFTTTVTGLSVSANSAGSSDSDGTISAYSWTFGDGGTSTAVNPTHVYNAAGTFTIGLTVTDNRGGTKTVTHDVTVEAANQAPVAAFTSQATNLVLAVDGSTSSDPDGTVASYSWNFGDSGTATGATASHTYTQAGTYTVTLTVTDNKGATNVKTAQVTVSAPAGSNALANDTFARTVANGWGTADLGGAWSLTGTAARFSVAGGQGVITLNSSVGQQANLNAVSSSSSRVAATFSVDKIANAQYISIIGRQVGSDQYLVRARVAADGTVGLLTMRNGVAVGSTYTVPGLTITPGASYNVVFDVTGTTPTTLSAKMWKAGSAEPAAWQLTRTDSTAALQAAGSVGVYSYVPTSAAAYPVRLSFTKFAVTNPAAPAGNQAPVAAFTSAVSGLGVSVDGSSSTDADGSIASYSWAFGDGSTATGATASRTYTSAGTYTVTLTVTDNAGATNVKTAQVTVTAPPAQNVAPVAAFTSAVSGLGVSVDGSSSTDADGSIASYSWAFGDGATATGATASRTYTAAGTYTVTLTVTDNAGATNVKTAQVTVAAVPAGGNGIAQDLFERVGANGWGTADQGGAWSLVGTASRFSVADGAGKVSVSTGQAQNANLGSVSSANTRVTAEFSVDKVVDGQYIGIVGRQVGASQYILRLRPENGGQLRAYVLRDATAVGASFLIPGVTLTAGEKFTVSFEVTGSGTTALNAKVWKSADVEPTAWQVSRTDTAAAMQAPGSVGVFTWLPSAAAASNPVTVAFYGITVINPTLP